MAAGHLPGSPKPSGAATASLLALHTGPGGLSARLLLFFPLLLPRLQPLPPGRGGQARVPAATVSAVGRAALVGGPDPAGLGFSCPFWWVRGVTVRSV